MSDDEIVDPDKIIDPLVCPACGVDAVKLRLLADLMDSFDAQRQVVYGRKPSTEVQDELRAWAKRIEEQT